MRLIIFGPPGAGKGTVAAQVTERCGVAHVSTGDMLRAAVAAGSDLGRRVEGILSSGGLVSDDLMIELVRDRLGRSDVASGWLLDGFPRTVRQAEALDKLLSEMGQGIDRVLLVAVPDEMIVERLGGRRVCLECGATYHVVHSPPKTEGKCDRCGAEQVVQRDDDKPETVRQRLATYASQTAPLIAAYRARGILAEFDNSGSPEETAVRVAEALAKL